MTSSSDFQKAIELVKKSERVLITTHLKPDGDACGSIAALCELLNSLGKKVRPLVLSPVPQWYAFLFAEKVTVLDEDVRLEDLRAERFDLIIIVDTNSTSQLPQFDEYLKQSDAPVLVIDHHETSDGLGDVELNDRSAAAAGLIVFELLRHAGWAVTESIARALFVAIATDTGWFQFSNTNSRTLGACAELIDAGARPMDIYANLYQNFSHARFRLMVVMLSSLELHLDGRYAAMQLTQRDFQQTGAALGDTESLINECHRIGTVKASALFIEFKDGRIRCSLRSRGGLDVSQIALKFGGGGHTMSAGTFLPGPLENARELVLKEMQTRL
ncbi:MAG: bifunctional oligoribonuclease/PAP phosphatase NrnA [Phycisphaerales bacterium]|nr:MAG: bifunctional oligoribonuclease/PAP phosphatase NrnA [Phycisphaerales bacterium]